VLLWLAGGLLAPTQHLLGATMELLQFLRPPSMLEFAAGGHYSQGWATCFANVGDLMLAIPWAPNGCLRIRDAEEPTAFRALLAPTLPLLAHTAAKFEILHQQTAQSGSSPAAAPAASSPGVVPADSALLLLMGASAVVERCVAVGLLSAAGCNTISGRPAARGQPSSCASQPCSRGASTAGNQGGSSGDDLVAAFKSLLSLARLLVSDGPWWEEARAKYPLLLIEALFKVGAVSHCWMRCMMAAANLKAPGECTEHSSALS
jgi:hypothetical protein